MKQNLVLKMLFNLLKWIYSIFMILKISINEVSALKNYNVRTLKKLRSSGNSFCGTIVF